MQELKEKKCEPCESDTQPMTEKQVEKHMEMLTPEWEVVDNKKTIGRNDPCPCGSGKKYKKCCYPKYE